MCFFVRFWFANRAILSRIESFFTQTLFVCISLRGCSFKLFGICIKDIFAVVNRNRFDLPLSFRLVQMRYKAESERFQRGLNGGWKRYTYPNPLWTLSEPPLKSHDAKSKWRRKIWVPTESETEFWTRIKGKYRIRLVCTNTFRLVCRNTG